MACKEVGNSGFGASSTFTHCAPRVWMMRCLHRSCQGNANGPWTRSSAFVQIHYPNRPADAGNDTPRTGVDTEIRIGARFMAQTPSPGAPRRIYRICAPQGIYTRSHIHLLTLGSFLICPTMIAGFTITQIALPNMAPGACIVTGTGLALVPKYTHRTISSIYTVLQGVIMMVTIPRHSNRARYGEYVSTAIVEPTAQREAGAGHLKAAPRPSVLSSPWPKLPIPSIPDPPLLLSLEHEHLAKYPPAYHITYLMITPPFFSFICDRYCKEFSSACQFYSIVANIKSSRTSA